MLLSDDMTEQELIDATKERREAEAEQEKVNDAFDAAMTQWRNTVASRRFYQNGR